MSSSAIYAGTFDPITYGHLDLVERAARVFDRLIVAVPAHTRKDPMFSVDERVLMVREAIEQNTDLGTVHVQQFDGLLVEFARSQGITVLVRGVRAHSDFEYEFQMALTNRKLAPDVETLFLMPKETHSYLSSSTIREAAMLGGDISDFVPPNVAERMRRHFSRGPQTA